MRIVKIKRFIPGFTAITIAPVAVFILEDHATNKVTLNHERIHWEQQRNAWFIWFYIRYFIEWIFKGYRNISYEREAYKNERDFKYHP